MELKPGYKQTEVGVIPEDWDIATFDKVADIIDPQPDHRTPPETSGGEPYIGISDFINDTFVDWDGCRKIISKALDKQQKSFQIDEGDIIFGKIGTIGFPKFLPITSFRYALSANVILIKPKIAPHFLMSWLKSRWIQKQIDQDLHSTSQAAFGILKMRKLLITLPSPPEQKAIATALSDIDDLLGVLDRLIAKKQNLKQSAMQELLTGKKRLSGFAKGKDYKETEMGLIPEDWNICNLQQVCSAIVDGTHYTPRYVSDGVPFYSVENVTANDFRNTKFISEQEHINLIKRCKPEKGDILLTRIGSLGVTKLIDWDVNASIYVSLALLKLNKSAVPAYIYVYSKSQQFVEDVEKRSLVNATPKKINMEDIGKVPVLIPQTEQEQKAIANILSDMDTEIAALKKRRDKTHNIKQAMMQELLTGKTRLVAPGGNND